MKNKRFWTTRIIAGCLLSTWFYSFAIGQKLAPQYCFNGSTSSPVGNSYTLSAFSIGNDSLFTLVDKFYSTKNDRTMDKPWKTEIVTGRFNINRDTIHCTVEIPKDQYGKLYIYHIKRQYLVLLDENKQPLQKWKVCSGR